MSGERAPARDLDLLAAVRNAARQDQFLDVISAAEARSRFESAIDFTPLPDETVTLQDALERVLASLAPVLDSRLAHSSLGEVTR